MPLSCTRKVGLGEAADTTEMRAFIRKTVLDQDVGGTAVKPLHLSPSQKRMEGISGYEPVFGLPTFYLNLV
jgi:hypothetical protein